MEKPKNEVGGGGGCKHKGCAKPAVTWRVRRGRITLKGGIATSTHIYFKNIIGSNKHKKYFKCIMTDELQVFS